MAERDEKPTPSHNQTPAEALRSEPPENNWRSISELARALAEKAGGAK